ncbi:MAG: chemotaxis protein CheA [Polyangiales bacterium]
MQDAAELEQQILETFAVEAAEHLEQLEQEIVALEGNPEDAERVALVFRIVHTLKGAAGCAGVTAVTELAHAFEGLLDRIRKGALAVTPSRMSMFLASVDALRGLIEGSSNGEAVTADAHRALLERLHRETVGGDAEEVEEADDAGPAPEAAAVATAHARDASTASAPVPSSGTPERAGAPAGPPKVKTLRAEIDRVDRMVALLGEMFVARNRLGDLLTREVPRATLLDAHEESGRLFEDLQDLVTKLRAVPIGPTMRQHVRTVRDAAAAVDKQALLILEGEDVEVDIAVVEGIRDPLLHLVRNCVAHGIEDPMERLDLDKNLCGLVTIAARRDGAFVEVTVSDDGRGLDRERILAKAMKLRPIADPAALTDEEVWKFIFEPGFSTTDNLTAISGRGVGMDVVLRNVQALRGSLDVRSVRGQGASFVMRLPMSLSIVRGFGVGASGETYILPLENIDECVPLPPDEAQRGAPIGVVSRRGVPLPYVRLEALVGITRAPARFATVVVLRHGDRSTGLVVDALYGASQYVVKPLTQLLSAVPGVVGSALLPDGRVSLVLDIGRLFDSPLFQRAGQAARAAA